MTPITEKRSKHIDIWYHYICEVIARKLAEVYFIDGDNNPADLLTKNLGIIKFQKFRALLDLEFFWSASILHAYSHLISYTQGILSKGECWTGGQLPALRVTGYHS